MHPPKKESSVQSRYFKHAISSTTTVTDDRARDVEQMRRTIELNWARYIKTLPILGHCVDIGIGPGTFLESCKQLGFARATGIDRSSDCCEYVKCVKRTDLEIVCSDAQTFLSNTRERFDLMTAFHVLEHLDRTLFEHMLTLMRETLTPQGLLILETPNMSYPLASYHLWGDPTHVVGYTPGALRTLVEANGFSVIAMGEKKNPITSFSHRCRQLVADFYLHAIHKSKVLLLDGPANLRARENIFSPYFWLVAKKDSK